MPYINATEFGNSALYVVGFLLRYSTDFIERVNGKMPFDNTTMEYQVNVADPATNIYLSGLLNAGVARIAADPAALNYYERNYEPTGEIDIPVITLHTTRDPAIPIAHEAMFAASVAAAGRSQLLLQREVNAWGHCAIPPNDAAAAFTDLVTWVYSGHRP